MARRERLLWLFSKEIVYEVRISKMNAHWFAVCTFIPDKQQTTVYAYEYMNVSYNVYLYAL